MSEGNKNIPVNSVLRSSSNILWILHICPIGIFSLMNKRGSWLISQWERKCLHLMSSFSINWLLKGKQINWTPGKFTEVHCHRAGTQWTPVCLSFLRQRDVVSTDLMFEMFHGKECHHSSWKSSKGEGWLLNMLFLSRK